MIGLFMFIFACDSPVPLPPKTQSLNPTDTRMVQIDNLRGYLQRPVGSGETTGVLLIVDQINQAARNKAKDYPKSTVVVIDTLGSIEPGKAYLQGMKGIEKVQVVCRRDDCSDVNVNP